MCPFIFLSLIISGKLNGKKQIKSDYHVQSLTEACYEGIWQIVGVLILERTITSIQMSFHSLANIRIWMLFGSEDVMPVQKVPLCMVRKSNVYFRKQPLLILWPVDFLVNQCGEQESIVICMTPATNQQNIEYCPIMLSDGASSKLINGDH